MEHRPRAPRLVSTSHLVSLGAAWALLAACGGSDAGTSSAAPVVPDAPPSRVCPGCSPSDVAGGETSDFSGQDDACTGDRAPLSEAGELLPQLEQLIAANAGPFESSLRWSYGRYFEPSHPSAFWLALPDGYEPSSSVTGNVTFGEPEYYVGRSRIPDDASIDCPSWVRVPAQVELATADGAIGLTLAGAMATGPRHMFPLHADADLAEASGGLDLHLDPAVRYTGGVEFDMVPHSRGKRGTIRLAIRPVDLDSGLDLEYPLEADFPDDGCRGSEGFPVDPDEPLTDSGTTAAGLIADWNAFLAGLDITGVWKDCRRAGVSVELGVPTLVCSTSTAASPNLSFYAPSRMRSSDGRLDLSVTRALLSEDRLSLSTPEPLERLTPAELAERDDVRGVDPGTSPWLTTFAQASFVRDPAALMTAGYVRIEGLESEGANAYSMRETFDWPPDSPAAPACP